MASIMEGMARVSGGAMNAPRVKATRTASFDAVFYALIVVLQGVSSSPDWNCQFGGREAISILGGILCLKERSVVRFSNSIKILTGRSRLHR
jgi:hypothetical protein